MPKFSHYSDQELTLLLQQYGEAAFEEIYNRYWKTLYNEAFRRPGYSYPGYSNPGYSYPGYSNPGYSNPGYSNKHLLWPLPQIEFDLNPGLNQATDQNPGY